MAAWRIVFMGTPEFAEPSLAALLDGDDSVVGVFTQPDRKVGRGMKMKPPPIKRLLMEHAEGGDIPVFQPGRLRDSEPLEALKRLKPDLVVVAAYGQILSKEVLGTPRYGCLNVHASILPRWRGAAPIHRALLAGDEQIGVTIMGMDEGLDTGPMFSKRSIAVPSGMTGGEAHDRMAALGAELLMETLPDIKDGSVIPETQPEHGVTYAHKLSRDDSWIDWQRPAAEIRRQIDALDPWPSGQTLWKGKPLKLFTPKPMAGSGAAPGEVTALHKDGFEVACGDGSLLITGVQAAGKRRMLASDWLRGRALKVGEQFEMSAGGGDKIS
ncbi:MAG: methionyl-tRNA formyltransferase [Magnetococcales bacterium]|nr:methionyl-tRNA formyltransferase [Magnetococcales bacterium]